MQHYSTPAFLQAYTRFAARYGHPTELRINEGSQLMSACKNMEISIVDIKDNLTAKHQVGVKFSTCHNRLLLGRNNRRALGGFATVSSPSRLIEQMDRVYEVWWKIWKSEKLILFPSLVNGKRQMSRK